MYVYLVEYTPIGGEIHPSSETTFAFLTKEEANNTCSDLNAEIKKSQEQWRRWRKKHIHIITYEWSRAHTEFSKQILQPDLTQVPSGRWSRWSVRKVPLGCTGAKIIP